MIKIIKKLIEKAKEEDRQLEILKEIVYRNKLKTNSQVSIDEIVEYLVEHDISLYGGLYM